VLSNIIHEVYIKKNKYDVFRFASNAGPDFQGRIRHRFLFNSRELVHPQSCFCNSHFNFIVIPDSVLSNLCLYIIKKVVVSTSPAVASPPYKIVSTSIDRFENYWGEHTHTDRLAIWHASFNFWKVGQKGRGKA
jgi:hypothetical protein